MIPFFFSLSLPQPPLPQSPCSSLETWTQNYKCFPEQAESFMPLCCLICLGCFFLCCLFGKLLYNLQDPSVNFSVKSSLPASIFLLSGPTALCRLLDNDLLDLTVLVSMSVSLYRPWLFPGVDSVPSSGAGVQEVLGKPFHFIYFIPHPVPKPNDLKSFMVM